MKLDELAIKHGTDKSSKHHNYTESYEIEFKPLHNKKLNILEVGIYEGASLKLWKEYFPKSTIVGVDIVDMITKKHPDIIDNKQCFIEIGSQDNIEFLTNISNKYKNFDIMIEDASHMASLSIKSFEILFPLLKSGGKYIIEDVGVFYSNSGKGSTYKDLGEGKTTMEYMFRLVNQINNEWYLDINNKPTSYYYKNIKGIKFYQGMIVIDKK